MTQTYRGRKRARVSQSVSESLDSASKMMKNRTEESTKGIYTSKLKMLIEYFKEKHPNCLNETQDEIIVPIPDKNAITSFFGMLCQAALTLKEIKVEDITEDTIIPLSHSAIAGHKSALKDLYADKKCLFDEDLDRNLEIILESYKKTIATLKQEGKMKSSEGKSPFTFDAYVEMARTFMKTIPSVCGGTHTEIIVYCVRLHSCCYFFVRCCVC